MWNLFHYIFLGVVDFNSFRGIARIYNRYSAPESFKIPQKKSGFIKNLFYSFCKKSVILIPEDMSCGINLSVSHSLDSSPDRRASGETVSFAGTAKASPIGGGGIAQR